MKMKIKFKSSAVLSQDLCEQATLRIIAEMLRLKVSHIKDRMLLSMYLIVSKFFNIIRKANISKKVSLTLVLSFHVEGDNS